MNLDFQAPHCIIARLRPRALCSLPSVVHTSISRLHLRRWTLRLRVWYLSHHSLQTAAHSSATRGPQLPPGAAAPRRSQCRVRSGTLLLPAPASAPLIPAPNCTSTAHSSLRQRRHISPIYLVVGVPWLSRCSTWRRLRCHSAAARGHGHHDAPRTGSEPGVPFGE